MRKVETIILNNLDKHSHFEEYFKIIDIIEENESLNPDICIESCKALVEGVSKTILINLDNTKTPDNIDSDNLPKLFKDAMKLLSDECIDIEGDFVIRFSGIIQVLGEIRNKRGDISHGRMAPKAIFSSKKLASTVKNMTESMLEYVLEHYFTLEITVEKLQYNSTDMKNYNQWLDDSVDFPIKKASYSQLLYENDYDEYENRYHNEFVKDDDVNEGIEEVEELSKPKKKLSTEKEIKSEPEVLVEVSNPTIEALVNDFYEDLFWTDKRQSELKKLALDQNLNADKLKVLVSDILFTEKAPLRDEVVDAMLIKPTLKERAKVSEEMTKVIMTIAQQLNKIE